MYEAIDVGVDGINLHHNFESLCACDHCRLYARGRMTQCFDDPQLMGLFGTADLAELEAISPREDCPAELKQRYALELQRAAHHQRRFRIVLAHRSPAWRING